VVPVVFNSFPSAVQHKNKLGEYTLHTAIARHQLEEVILKMIELLPSAVKETDAAGYYPLHLACRTGSETLIMKLLEMFPVAAGIPVSGNVFALHLACDYNKSLAVIQKLVELYPLALKNKVSGWCPIQNAAFSGRSQNGVQVLNYLLEIDPTALKRRPGGNGRTVLHVACRQHRSIDIIRYLVHHQGIPINMKDNDGDTPLHIACRRQNYAAANLLLQHPNIDVNVRN
jgi:ankyrin repeat protein